MQIFIKYFNISYQAQIKVIPTSKDNIKKLLTPNKISVCLSMPDAYVYFHLIFFSSTKSISTVSPLLNNHQKF